MDLADNDIAFASTNANDNFFASITNSTAPEASESKAQDAKASDIVIAQEDSFDFLLDDDDFLSDEDSPAEVPPVTQSTSYAPSSTSYSGQNTSYTETANAAFPTSSAARPQPSYELAKPKSFFAELPMLSQPKLMRRIEQFEQHTLHPVAQAIPLAQPAQPAQPIPPPATRSPYAPPTALQTSVPPPAVNPYALVQNPVQSVPQNTYTPPPPLNAAASPIINPYAATSVSSPISAPHKSVNAYIPSPDGAFASLVDPSPSQNIFVAPASQGYPPSTGYAPGPAATNAYESSSTSPMPNSAYQPVSKNSYQAAPLANAYDPVASGYNLAVDPYSAPPQPPTGLYGQSQPAASPPRSRAQPVVKSHLYDRASDAYDPPFLPSTFAPPRRTASQLSQSGVAGRQAPPRAFSPQQSSALPSYAAHQYRQPQETAYPPSAYAPSQNSLIQGTASNPLSQQAPLPVSSYATSDVPYAPPNIPDYKTAADYFSPPQTKNQHLAPNESASAIPPRAYSPRPNRGVKPEPYPLFSWAADGRMVTIFPTQNPQTAFNSTELDFSHSTIKITNAKDEMNERASFWMYAKFPGPVFSVGSKSANKSKKKDVLKWMDTKISDAENMVYEALGANAKREAEDMVVLWKCMRVLLKYDGRYAGNAESSREIRLALVPESVSEQSQDELANFSSATDLYQRHVRNASGASVDVASTGNKKLENLTNIRKYLLKGDREAALMSALENDMWGHALLISNTIGKDRWIETVHEFVKSDVKSLQTPEASSLAVIYNVFAGAGGDAGEQIFSAFFVANNTNYHS